MRLYSKDLVTDYILRDIGEKKVSELNSFCDEVSNKNFKRFSSFDDALNYFEGSNEYLHQRASYKELEDIKYYSGFSYVNINALLRGTWNYERNGIASDEKKREYLRVAEDISKTISKCAQSTGNIITYRGVNINTFYRFGIQSIKDLPTLVGSYIYDAGFLSTSLVQNESFFARKLDWHEDCNVEIELMLSEECDDAIPLLSTSTSYSPNQVELLINKGSLIKVVGVSLSEDGQKATVRAVHVPRKMWDLVLKDDIDRSL